MTTANRFRFRIWDVSGKRYEDEGKLYQNGVDASAQSRYGDVERMGFEIGNNWIVQQSTGCLDKNGKEIFEGDILAVADLMPEEAEPANYAVRFGCGTYDSGFYKYQGFYLESAREDDATGGLLFETERLSVIGSIYRNPELLSASRP